jgi:hypothetical protein
VISVVPAVAADVARPCDPPVLLMVAIAGVPDAHVTVVVRVCVVEPVYVPVATHCFCGVESDAGVRRRRGLP